MKHRGWQDSGVAVVNTLVVALCLVLAGLALHTSLQAAPPRDSIDAFIDREMPAAGAPGLAYAVVADGEIQTLGARGVLRLGEEEAVTPDTLFSIGSVSKSFTALAVLQLVEGGKVDLDAEISQYVDGFADGPARAVTIRQLLSHTSGFSTLQGNTVQARTDGGKDALARRVEDIARWAPDTPSGSTWAYSNTNYAVLGRVIEVVSGQNYASYVEAHILEPVGMDHSFVADGEVHPEMATGHVPWFGTKRPLPTGQTDLATAPQGGVVASARDLARYLQVMLNGEDDILSAEAKAAMMRPASDASPYYGFGWFLDTEQGSVFHTGLTPGFEARAAIVAAEGKGVVVLVNGCSGVGFGESTELMQGTSARALGLDYEGEGGRWSRKLLFVSLALAPLAFLASLAWAWWRRRAIRGKRTTAFGRFSLWFPLSTTVAGAWVMLDLLPGLFGTPLGTLRLFQPDLVLIMIASAVTGVVWAVLRLVVAYTGSASAA